MIAAGFLIGFFGSWHCIAMCGPIALMVPGSKGKNRFIAISLYHGGKVLAYLSIGSIFGMVPAFIDSFKIQSVITVSVGLVMLALALVPALLSKLESRGFKLFSRYFSLKKQLADSLNKNKIEYSFYIGFLNGFVPCGMVYMAALGAMSQPYFSHSLLFMLLFGIGTIPLMSLFLIAAGYFKFGLKKFAPQFRMVAFVIVGFFMIWKGSIHYSDSLNPPKEGDAFDACTLVTASH